MSDEAKLHLVEAPKAESRNAEPVKLESAKNLKPNNGSPTNGSPVPGSPSNGSPSNGSPKRDAEKYKNTVVEKTTAVTAARTQPQPELKLLIEWPSAWEEFKGTIRPALAHSEKALAGEARAGLFPYRGMLVSWAAEVLLFFAVMFILRGFDSMHPYQPPAPNKYDVIYYSGDELPKVEDAGGAQSGRTGRGGGQQAFHRTQTIRVARGETVREKVVDAPKLNLPHSDTAVANLLAYKPVPGPPPAEGMRSSLRALQSPQMTPIAPAPEVDREKMQAAPALTSTVVQPAPAAQNLAALRLPGSQPVQVVPPPVSAPEQLTNSNPKLTLPSQAVVAPPVQVNRETAMQGPGYGQGDLRKQVVPPPVQVGSDTGETRTMAGLGSASAVPPPVQVGGGQLSHEPVSGLGGGMAAVPPAPALSGGTSLTGRGRGNRGIGTGGIGEMGDVAAPPSGGGTGGGSGVVISNQPGSKVGVGSGGAGSLAMSPGGGANPGLGGSGGGEGIGRGNGPGAGLYGEGTGAGRDGSGRGSDPNARGGISPFSGPGGTGAGNGKSAVPGVSVRGGSNIVTLPSFGSDGSQQPSVPGRSNTGADDRPGLTVEATPRSGGAFNFYGVLKGDKAYTIYIDTIAGTVVMEYSDPTSADHPYGQALMPPQPMRAGLPANLRHSRLVIACVLDRFGMVQNAQVLESAERETTAKVLAALPGWKFRPAMRGDQPVEVNALLGFDIDTSDRY